MAYLPPGGGRMNVTIGSNTAGVGALISTGTLALAGGNNVTLSQNGANGLTIHAAAPQGSIKVSAGANSASLSAITFADSNGINFGLNAGTITASHNGLTSQSNQALSASNGSFAFQTAGFSNANGVTFGTSAGSIMTASVNTSYAASNHSHGNPTLALTNISGTTASASNGLTLSLSAAAPGAGGGVGLSAGTQSVSTGTVNFANSNGVSFGMSGSNQITASVATDYASSNHSHGNPTLNLTNLSGTTASASNGLTLSLSAAAQSVQTQSRFNLSVGGNSTSAGAGYINISSGQMLLAGGNNITLSQNGNSVSIVGGAGGGGGGIALANSQTTYTSGTVNLAGDNGVTVYTDINQSYRISIPQTSSLAGVNGITLSTTGGTINIGGGGGVALVTSNTTYSSGSVQFSNAGGALTIATNTNQRLDFSVPATSSLVGTNGISISTNGNTISISQVDQTQDFYQNMDRGTTALLGTANGTLMLQRLNQENQRFAADITANTMMLNMSGNLTATASSSAHTYSMSVGIYSDLVTNLSLLNSASTSWALAANTSISGAYNGARWVSFVSSQWSSAPVFQQDAEYVFGVVMRSSGLAVPMSYIGQNYMNSVQRSGYMGTSIATNNTMAQGNFWNAMYTASTTALPTNISASQVNRNNATAIFMPHIILNNRYAGTF